MDSEANQHKAAHDQNVQQIMNAMLTNTAKAVRALIHVYKAAPVAVMLNVV